MLSIYEIAHATGVCPATVSRALNPALRHKVKSSTLTRILTFCEEHHYYGKLSARSLATGKTYCIGLILGALEQDFSSPFFAEQVHGIIDVLTAHGYRLKIIPVSSSDPHEIDLQMRKILMSGEVDGFILNFPMVGPETLRELHSASFPAVIQSAACTQPSPLGIPSVGIDNHAGYGELCHYLRDNHLHRIAILGKTDQDSRLKILLEEAAQMGLKPDCLMNPNLSGAIGYQAQQMYLAVRDDLPRLLSYDAWITLTDLWAMGARQALLEAGKEQEVFLCGYDNIEEMEGYSLDTTPSLNTIAIPRRELGRTAAEKLFQADASTDLILLKSKFILRTPST